MSESIRARIRGALRIDYAFNIIWKSDPKRTIVSFALLLLSGIVPTISLYLIKRIVDSAVELVAADPPSAAVNQIIWLVAVAGAVAILAAIVQTLAGYMETAQTLRVVNYVQSTIHKKSIRLDLSYYEDPKYHDTLHRAQEEAPYRPGRILSDVFSFCRNAISLAGIGALLVFTFHWVFVLLLLITALPVVAIRLKYARRFFHWHKSQTTIERKIEYLNFIITGSWFAKEVRSFQLGDLFRGNSSKFRKEFRDGRLKIERSRMSIELVAQVSQAAILFILIGYVVVRVINKGQTVGDVIMLYQAFQRGQAAINGMMASIGDLYENNLFLSYYTEFMELAPRVKSPSNPVLKEGPVTQSFSFKDIYFKYPHAKRAALRGVSLEVIPGEIVAITGENGAGKSTLVRLISRLHDPTAGRLELDGIDIRDLALEDLRSRMSVLYQDPSSYYVSAKENIWYGDVEAPIDNDRVAEAADRSGVADFAKALPRDTDSVLGTWFDDGSEISTGQWKKIALARLYYANKQILILDEPTTALDAASEAKLLNNLRDTRKNRLVLLVSHRMSTVSKADRIYVMHDGEIVEFGSHVELLKENGLYKRLCKIQGAI
ncbi:MAG: ABC transporter ATP-binding protein [Spirochaetales bacterium]|jgi:ATP-binding cassette, subfamily B, bacterial|nr:ABC transporter ATP-binding protein [Spirochaetales bacterium]